MKVSLFKILFLFCIATHAQTNQYKVIDSLIETNSMTNAINVLKNLKENFIKDSVNAAYWLRYSKASYIAFRYEEAATSIEKAIRKSPNDSELYFEKGLMYNKLDKIEQALTAFQKAIKIKKDGKYFYWKGIINQQLRKIDSTENDYQTAINLKFENVELYNNFAILLAESERFEKALTIVNKAIKLDNKFASAYGIRAKINFSLLNFDGACADEIYAIKLGYRNPLRFPDTFCNGNQNQKLELAANLFAVKKSYKQAVLAYSMLIANNVLKSDFFLNRGYCYYQQKDYLNAEKDYLKALTLPKPTTEQIYNNLSLLYFDTNKFEKSIAYSTKSIALNPENYVRYIDRGLCYRKLRNYSNAEKDFNKSLEIKPDFHRAFGYRAFLYLEQSQFKKAFEDASKSVEINPQYAYGYIVLAQAKQELGLPNYCEDYYNAKKYGDPDAETALKKFCK